jgi:hypothetical protein
VIIRQQGNIKQLEQQGTTLTTINHVVDVVLSCSSSLNKFCCLISSCRLPDITGGG